MAGPIRISILADGSNANRAFASVSANAGGMGVRVGKAGKALGVAVAAGTALAGAAALKFGADSVKAASNAQQSLGATETVFGKYADTVIKRSNEAATAIGVSANEYRELSNVVGASLTGAGISIQKATVLTGDLNKRAADMAATFGGTTKEAVEAVSSALRGETDPIERYGVSVKAADVSARLAAQGQDQLTGSALKAAEMQARLDLIMEKTALTQGAFGRESNTLANQQQVLGAQFENLKARIGTALLPVLTSLLTTVNANLIPAFEATVEFIRPVITAVQEFFAGLGQDNGKVTELGAFLTTQVIPAVQGVIDAFKGYLSVVIPILQQVAAAVIDGWSQIQPQVRSVWTSVKSIIVDALAIIRTVVQKVTAVVSAVWAKFGGQILSFITSTMKNVGTVVSGAFQVIAGLFKAVKAILTGDWSALWAAIKQIVSGATSVVKGILSQAWNVIRAATSAAWTAIKALISAAWEGIKSVVTNQIRLVIALVRGLPGRILSALGSLGSLLYNAGRDIIQGLLDGIGDMVGKVTDKLGEVTNLIPDWKGPPEKDRTLLRGAGQLIMQGLVDGLEAGKRDVRESLLDITKMIAKAKITGPDAGKIRKALRGVVDGFDLEGGLKRSEVRDEFAEFKRVLREAGIELPKNFDQMRDRSLDLADRFNRVTRSIERTEESLETWRDTAAKVGDAVRSIYNNDIFAKGGLASAMLQLQADTNDTRERTGLLAGVKALADQLKIDTSTAAFQAIATSADVQTLRDLDTAAEVQAFFAAFGDRADAQNDAAEYAANAVTGEQIAALEATLSKQEATLDKLNRQLEAQEQRLEAAAVRGTTQGAREGTKQGFADRERVKSAKARTR